MSRADEVTTPFTVAQNVVCFVVSYVAFTIGFWVIATGVFLASLAENSKHI